MTEQKNSFARIRHSVSASPARKKAARKCVVGRALVDVLASRARGTAARPSCTLPTGPATGWTDRTGPTGRNRASAFLTLFEARGPFARSSPVPRESSRSGAYPGTRSRLIAEGRDLYLDTISRESVRFELPRRLERFLGLAIGRKIFPWFLLAADTFTVSRAIRRKKTFRFRVSAATKKYDSVPRTNL